MITPHLFRFAGVSLVGLLVSGCDIQAQSAVTGSFERTLHVSGPSDVRVVSRSGAIHVAAGSGDTVQVKARIRAYGDVNLFRAYTPEQQVRKLETAPPVEQDGNTITIGDVDDWMLVSNVGISYELTVPPDARVTTSSRSGDQTIAAIAGPIDASSRSGRITVDGVRGPLRLASRSGDVTVTGEPAARWDIYTRSGDVEVRVPSSAGFDVAVSTRSGRIDTERTVENNGRFARGAFEAKVRGGGARVDVQTRSGSIRIE